MSAPRSSVRVLRKITQTYNVAPTLGKRKLHMTGPTSHSPILVRDIESAQRPTMETASVYIAPASATIIDPLSIVGARSSSGRVRHFNTSRCLKAVGDSSTIDFAYLPDLLDADNGAAARDDPGRQVRVPIMGFMPRSTKTGYTAEEEEIVMKPQIVLASAEDTHIVPPSVFADVHDNSSVSFEGLSSRVDKAVDEIKEEGGMIRQVWSGLLDDLFGEKAKKRSS